MTMNRKEEMMIIIYVKSQEKSKMFYERLLDFYVDQPNDYYARLVDLGGTGISKTELRNWGDLVAYGSDLDGHILAFAIKGNNQDKVV